MGIEGPSPTSPPLPEPSSFLLCWVSVGLALVSTTGGNLSLRSEAEEEVFLLLLFFFFSFFFFFLTSAESRESMSNDVVVTGNAGDDGVTGDDGVVT